MKEILGGVVLWIILCIGAVVIVGILAGVDDWLRGRGTRN